MGFLADVGRANPIEAVQNYQISLQNMATSEANRQHAIANTEEIRNRMKYEQEQRLRQEEEDNQPINITADPNFLMLPKESQEFSLEYLRKNGIIDEHGVGPRWKIRKAVEDVQQSPVLFKNFMEPVIAQQQTELLRLTDELKTLQAKGANPSKIEAVRNQLVETAKRYNQASTIYAQHIKELEADIERKKKLADKIEFERAKNKIETPPEYGESLSNAIDAINQGKDPVAVYKKMVKTYPKRAKDLKNILFNFPSLPEQVKTDLLFAVEEINDGKNPYNVYRTLSGKWPKHSKTIRRVLLTPDKNILIGLRELLNSGAK